MGGRGSDKETSQLCHALSPAKGVPSPPAKTLRRRSGVVSRYMELLPSSDALSSDEGKLPP